MDKVSLSLYYQCGSVVLSASPSEVTIVECYIVDKLWLVIP